MRLNAGSDAGRISVPDEGATEAGRRMVWLLVFLGPIFPAESGYASLSALVSKYDVQRTDDVHAGRIILSGRNRRVILLLGTRLALVNGGRVEMRLPTTNRGGAVRVSAELEDHLREMSVRKAPPEIEEPPVRVVLDPGHGGRDPGAVSHGLMEKWVNLDVALRVARLLEGRDRLEVVLTRKDDTRFCDEDSSRDLDARVNFANRRKADFFVSIHANACRNGTVRGMEIYVPRELEDVERRVAKSMREEPGLPKRYGESGDGRLSDTAWILHRMLLEEKYKQSLILGEALRRSMSRNARDEMRGLRECGFRVVKWSRCGAALIELGYLTNAASAALLRTKTYRQRLAELVAEGIRNYARLLRETRRFGDSTTGKRRSGGPTQDNMQRSGDEGPSPNTER